MQGSNPGYTCYMSLNTIKARINMLWEDYRTTQAWGKRSSEKQTNASKTFDIAKPDIEFRLCEIDLKFVQDQKNREKVNILHQGH